MSVSVQTRRTIVIPLKWLGYSALYIIIALAWGLLTSIPQYTRDVIAVSLVIFLLGLSIRRPTTTMYLLMLYLPVMGFIRRWLIPIAGWQSFDPLLIVTPVVISVIGSYWLYRRFVLRAPGLPKTKLFYLVQLLMLVDILEVANPHQGGLLAGFGGAMFYVIPLFWMILSKQHFTEKRMKIMLGTVVVIGLLVALYGLKQTFFGFYSFEQSWINLSGYAALYVGKSSRAFSTFTNAAEYAQYLVIAVAICWAFVLRGHVIVKLISILAMGFIGFALFLESSRSPIITGVLAITVMSIVAVKRISARITILMLAACVIVGLYIVLGHMTSSNNALISHQVSGLIHPLNKKDSTASGHLAMMFSGLTHAITNPIGSGLGATTTAAGKLGNVSSSNSEIDLSNMCISDGLVGGIIYLLIMIQVGLLAFAVNKEKRLVPLALLGVLIVTLGQWSNGGDYSTCAFVWLCIGYLDKATEKSPLNRRGPRRFRKQRAIGQTKRWCVEGVISEN